MTRPAELVKPTGQMTLTSPSFTADGPIPARYSKYGANVSPALEWSGAPAETRSFALVVSDPDAVPVVGREWVHWVVLDLPASSRGIPEGGPLPAGARQFKTDFGDRAYGGPKPPAGSGVHHYVFALYALKTDSLEVADGASLRELRDAIRPVTIDEAVLVGTYEAEAKPAAGRRTARSGV